jgi:hypothetical protein
LYIEPVTKATSSYEETVTKVFADLQKKYEGIGLVKSENGWMVSIPDKYKEGHEAHFGRVTERFIDYLVHGTMPEWEVPNMLAKYYTTTKALEVSKGK